MTPLEVLQWMYNKGIDMSIICHGRHPQFKRGFDGGIVEFRVDNAHVCFRETIAGGIEELFKCAKEKYPDKFTAQPREEGSREKKGKTGD